jgi:transposase
MSMSRRPTQRQQELWINTADIVAPAGHPFYRRLNHLLDQHAFDRFVEGRCEPFYAINLGRPSIPPGVYFRLLLIGYFEGIGSERGIAWRCADSLGLRAFLGYELNQKTPEHSSLSKIRGRIDIETHCEVFHWVLRVLAKSGLLKGKTIGIDATTLEANAALRSIVRRDTDQPYQAFLGDLAKAWGIETPTREDLARIDRKRPKKGCNEDWYHPHDPDAKITKMKDGRTHLKGHARILKRLLIHVAGCNLALVMRSPFGLGTPRGLQGLARSSPRLGDVHWRSVAVLRRKPPTSIPVRYASNAEPRPRTESLNHPFFNGLLAE